jgi:hypothetical protein
MDEMIRDIAGIIAVCSFAFPFLALVAIIGYKIYRKFRPARGKAGAETRAERMPSELSVPHQPTRPRRAIIIFIGMTLLVVLWGLMIGLTVGVFSHLIYIIFLIPLLMGFSSGKMIVDAIQRAKIRTIALLVLLSVLSAVVMYGTFHYTRYLGFQVKASLEIFSGLSEATETENLQVTKAFLDYALEEETGYSGFLGYILYEARQGTTIGRLFRSTSTHLGPVLTGLYWLMEFGIILGVTLQEGKKMIGMSFCESCGNRINGERHLGGTTPANEHLLLDLIRQKDFTELGKLLEKNAELPSTEVYFQGCQMCGSSQSQLIVRRASQGAKGILQFTDSSQTLLQPRDSMLLLNQMRSAVD